MVALSYYSYIPYCLAMDIKILLRSLYLVINFFPNYERWFIFIYLFIYLSTFLNIICIHLIYTKFVLNLIIFWFDLYLISHEYVRHVLSLHRPSTSSATSQEQSEKVTEEAARTATAAERTPTASSTSKATGTAGLMPPSSATASAATATRPRALTSSTCPTDVASASSTTSTATLGSSPRSPTATMGTVEASVLALKGYIDDKVI